MTGQVADVAEPTRTRSQGEYAAVEVVQVIKVVYPRGKGTEADPFRRVTTYFTMEGEELVECDPSA